MNDRKSETPMTDHEADITEPDGMVFADFARGLERRALKAEHACYVAGTDPDHALDVQIFKLRDSLAAAHEQIAKMRGALGQASFCLRELLPNDEDAQMTVRQINRALQEKAK